jgi:hypothetical protein
LIKIRYERQQAMENADFGMGKGERREAGGNRQ